MTISRAEMKLNEQMQQADYELAVSNKAFADATPAGKRVIIAQDVISWLKIGKIRARTGVYLDPSVPVYADDGTVSHYEDGALDPARVDGGKCTACALGSVFACTVERTGGRVGFWSNYRQSQQTAVLEPFFEVRQLRLIESAFEREDFCNDADEAVHFGQVVAGGYAARIASIMQNIIDNGGTFVPEQEPRTVDLGAGYLR